MKDSQGEEKECAIINSLCFGEYLCNPYLRAKINFIFVVLNSFLNIFNMIEEVKQETVIELISSKPTSFIQVKFNLKDSLS